MFANFYIATYDIVTETPNRYTILFQITIVFWYKSLLSLIVIEKSLSTALKSVFSKTWNFMQRDRKHKCVKTLSFY